MKQRLDLLIVERGLVDSRAKAQAIIMAGLVKSQTKVLNKPGMNVDPEIVLDIDMPSLYVSRGGEKLASVAEDLRVGFDGKVVLDVGSSTGGFTDFALQHGAVKVFAVDVGTAQLHYKLQQDPRVISMEQTDIRLVDKLPDLVDIAVMDVSFLSLRKVLPNVAKLLKPDGMVVAMAKPQFETDKPTADKFRGVISDPKVRKEILDAFEVDIKKQWRILASADSGVKGARGNRERFYLLRVKDQ